MQDIIGLGQRKGSLSDIKAGGYQTPGGNSISQMYQKFSDVPFNIGRSPIIQEAQTPQLQQQYVQPQYYQVSNQLMYTPSQNQHRIVEKSPYSNIQPTYENHLLQEQTSNKANNQHLDNIGREQAFLQYPYSCFGILKQEENPDDLYAEALLVGPYHIIVLASQMKKLIVTSDQNITKRLFFQYQGEEINVKDFFLNSSNMYAIALLEKDIGSQNGYLGVINAKINYFINLISKNKKSNNNYNINSGINNNTGCIININFPNQSYEITDINCKQLRISNSSYSPVDNDPQNSIKNTTKGWYLVKDEQLGFCIIGYSSNNTIPFINTTQVERWMSSSDETVQPDTFSFVASTKIDMKDLTDTTLQKAHSSGIYKICRVNHETVVSSSCDNSIKFWNPLNNSLIKNYKNDQCCRNFCISEDQQFLFGTCDNYIFRMKWKSNYEIDKAFSCQEKIYSICKVKVDEKTGHDIIASGDALGNIYIIDATQMQQIQFIPNSSTNKNGHNSSLNSICRINNNQIATAGGGGQLKIWMWEDGFLVKNLEGHNTQKNIYFVEKHPEKDNQLITASSDQTIRVWDINTGQQVKKILVNNSIYCANFLNEYELAVGDFNLLRIFNLRTWQYKKIDKHTCRINTICSLNERSFMSGDIEGNIFMFTFDEDNKNDDILLEGIQGDSKVLEISQNTQFNKTYKIVYPNYSNLGDVTKNRQHTDAVELSFERVENQSVRNPESSSKHQEDSQMKQDIYNQRMMNVNYGQQLPFKMQKQLETPVTVSTPLKQSAAVMERNRQNSVHLISSVPHSQNITLLPQETEGQYQENKKGILLTQQSNNDLAQPKSNYYQLQSLVNGLQVGTPNLNNNSNIINNSQSDKKDFSYNYKNPYQNVGNPNNNNNSNSNSNNNSLANIANPTNATNIRSQSEKKTENRNNSSFDMDFGRKERDGQEFSQPSSSLNNHDGIVHASGIKNPVNISQSALIAQKLTGSPGSMHLSQFQQQQQQQQQQQYPSSQKGSSINNIYERKRSNSVVKTSGQFGNYDESQIPTSYNQPQQNNAFSQPYLYQNQNTNNNNSISQSTIMHHPSQHQLNQAPHPAPVSQNGGRVYVVPRSSSAAKLSTPAQQQPIPTLSNNQSVASINQNQFNSPNPLQQAMLNNLINQKLNPANNSISNPSFNQMISPNQINKIQHTQLSYIQQQQPTLQTNSSAQKEQPQNSQLLSNPNNNSIENLQKVSLIGANSKESFGQKVRSFTRTPEKTPPSQSYAPSPILNGQQQTTQPTVQPVIGGQYKPQILKERNQGNSVDLGVHNAQNFRNENDDSSLFQKDSKMKQTYENHIAHLKSEISKLEQNSDSKNELIQTLTKEKAELYEIISQLKRETELVKLSYEKENKNKMDMIQCSNKLSELNSLNDELIKKIQHYQEQEKQNQQVLSDLIQSNTQLNSNYEQQQKKNSELESLVFTLKQQLQERDQHITAQQKLLKDSENQASVLAQKLEVSQRYNDEEVKNLQKQLAEKERYISNMLKGQQTYHMQPMTDQNKQSKALLKYFSDKDSISDINPYETEHNRTNTYQDQDSLLFKIDKDDDKSSAKFISNNGHNEENQTKDLKDKYKKIEIMASLRSAQDEVLNLKSQISKLRQEYGDQVELTDKYNHLNESFKQKTREVDNWRKIYNEIYEKA